ncbi:uncharacterized protein LOC110711005 isoform X2 [Chenopodium quinoa]|uniref:uncharacterized protein LOC110711005 isoform X2 n=1 Tax=Chenopodium quinoa TaxID=63459 RepID=UPI000B76E49B|nr:uncharacterized protein LOC110711005 isoform X2 [Chenopodium quinoa]
MSTIIPATNLINKLSLNLHTRFVSLPWLKRSVIRCFSYKADGPELPVRYIPKKLQVVEQAGCSSSVDNAPIDRIHTDSSSSNSIRRHRANHPRECRIDHEPSNVSFVETHVVQELQTFKRDVRGRGCKLNQENYNYNGAMDSEYLEGFEEDVEEPIEGLEAELYDGIDESKQKWSKICRTKQDVEKKAVELLAKRAFTGVELRKKLVAKDFHVGVVETVVTDFQNRGLINDSLYAEIFSNTRWKSSSWGPRRIKQALVKKGVSEGDVKKAVKQVFEDGEECDLRSSTKLSNSTLQQLYVRASKQWQLSQNVPHETRKARIIRWLQYRGFDWAVVSIILKKLESNNSP